MRRHGVGIFYIVSFVAHGASQYVRERALVVLSLFCVKSIIYTVVIVKRWIPDPLLIISFLIFSRGISAVGIRPRFLIVWYVVIKICVHVLGSPGSLYMWSITPALPVGKILDKA